MCRHQVCIHSTKPSTQYVKSTQCPFFFDCVNKRINNYHKVLECKIYPAFQSSLIIRHELPDYFWNCQHGGAMDTIGFLFFFIHYICIEQLPHERQGVKYYENFTRMCMGLSHLCLEKGVSNQKNHNFHLFLPLYMLPTSHINKAGTSKHQPTETKLMLRFFVTHLNFLDSHINREIIERFTKFSIMTMFLVN